MKKEAVSNGAAFFILGNLFFINFITVLSKNINKEVHFK